MPYIIVRKSGESTRKRSGSPRFYAHFNRSTGKYYGSERDYVSDLKSKGLEPYDVTVPDQGKMVKHKPSAKATGIIKSIGDHTRKGKFQPSGKLVAAMESIGVKTSMSRSDLAKLPAAYQTGGFSD